LLLDEIVLAKLVANPIYPTLLTICSLTSKPNFTTLDLNYLVNIIRLPRDLGDLEEWIYLNLGQHRLLEEFQHNQGSTKVRGCLLLEEF
jgi:hypothetical protein